MSVRVSVVVPVYNGERTLADCLRSLQSQNLPSSAYEVIVVDDGSTDASATVAAEFGVRVVSQHNAGAAAARNAGLSAARTDWVAFTDADCVASRGWLKALLGAAASDGENVICVAGNTMGLASNTPAARFVDLTGGLDAGRHLSHPRYPFAPSGNVLYRRTALLAVGGYDPRYRSYEACDLHQRLGALGGRCLFEPSALVFHRHRATWGQYWRQQRSYGGGLAHFMRARVAQIRWSAADELRAWGGVVANGARAILPGRPDAVLGRRGLFVKTLAQRLGFVVEYWGSGTRTKLSDMLGCARVIAQAVRTPSDALLLCEIGAFIVRLPGNVRGSSIPVFLRRIEVAPRPKALTIENAYHRVARLRNACLRMPRLWRRDTCYIRALTLYRFLDPGAHCVRVHFGVEQPQSSTDRLRGHAWISVDGLPFEAPEAVHERRIHEVPLSHAI
jgi:glycosyltransferase involved in cell wall biosynthesis